MSLHSSYGQARRVIACALAIMGAGAAIAADLPAANQPAPSKELREKMAVLHEQMAACLRTDKPIDECRSEMMKNCQNTLGKHGCHMGHGMMGGRPGSKQQT